MGEGGGGGTFGDGSELLVDVEVVEEGVESVDEDLLVDGEGRLVLDVPPRRPSGGPVGCSENSGNSPASQLQIVRSEWHSRSAFQYFVFFEFSESVANFCNFKLDSSVKESSTLLKRHLRAL